MGTRWGHDAEERQNVARKAQDAYAAARQAIEKVVGAEAAAVGCRAEAAELRVLLEAQERQTGRLQRALDAQAQLLASQREEIEALQQAIADMQRRFNATMPKLPRKVVSAALEEAIESTGRFGGTTRKRKAA